MRVVGSWTVHIYVRKKRSVVGRKRKKVLVLLLQQIQKALKRTNKDRYERRQNTLQTQTIKKKEDALQNNSEYTTQTMNSKEKERDKDRISV